MKLVLTLLSIICVLPLYAQDLHAWVYFKDKSGVSTSLQNPQTILTQRALTRKQRHGIAVDERDVPINQEYVTIIKTQSGVDYRTQSKWLNCAHVVGNISDLQSLENLDFVDRVVFAAASKSAGINTVKKYHSEVEVPLDYGMATNQIEMIGLDQLHNTGNTGAGVVIAVTDSGFPGVDSNSAFDQLRSNSDNRILGGYDFVAGDNSIFEDNFHGARVLSIMAASRKDQFEGSAPSAGYYLFRTEDAASETPVEMSYWVAAAERADSLGVDVMNVSLGYLGFDNPSESLTYEDMDGSSFISQGADIASQKGLLVVTSAGNFGRSSSHPYMGAPADVASVLSVGSVTSNGIKSSFSSIGPTRDGRIKPDVVAQGSATNLIREDDVLTAGNGTSYSGPIIAGAMASLVQAFPEITPQQLIEAVRNSGSQVANPDNQLGFGIPDFSEVFTTLSGSQPELQGKFSFFVKDRILYLNGAQNRVNDFQFYNLQGQLLLNERLINDEIVDLSSFSSGIYLFRLSGEAKAFKILLN
jgi:hypothetical protein